MIEMEQMILIAGSGQNVGKTSLACKIIQLIAVNHSVSALKVSGHQHKLGNMQTVIYKEEGLTISLEHDDHSNKDSSLFLQSGASRSYFIQVDDDKLAALGNWIQTEISGWMVCESGTLGQVIKPGKALFVGDSVAGKKPNWKFPYQKIEYNGSRFSPEPKEVMKDLK